MSLSPLAQDIQRCGQCGHVVAEAGYWDAGLQKPQSILVDYRWAMTYDFLRRDHRKLLIIRDPELALKMAHVNFCPQEWAGPAPEELKETKPYDHGHTA